METAKRISTVTEVAAHLRSLLTGNAEQDGATQDAIVVCERIAKERAELLKAVERLGRRLARCTSELDRAIRGLK